MNELMNELNMKVAFIWLTSINVMQIKISSGVAYDLNQTQI